MTAAVTIVASLYGPHNYERYVHGWHQSIRVLNTQPAQIIVGAETGYGLPDSVTAIVGPCAWRHPQAYYLQQAIEAAETEWVWILDIDDRATPRALDGIDQVDADVWMMGFARSDGERYIPPAITAAEVLESDRNGIPGTSAIRTEAFRECGGFRDVAFQDWALWRALAANGARFESSGRVGFRYRQSDYSRTGRELTYERRAAHLAEMHAAEGALVA